MGLSKFTKSFDQGNWFMAILLVLAAVVIALGGDELRQSLRYDRIWITEGETWRMVTGHFVHLGWAHLGLNVAGLLLVWFLVGMRFDLLSWWIVIGVCLLAVNIGLWTRNPELVWYVGLSGLLHGLLAAGIAAKLRAVDGETLLLAALLVAKLGWEQVMGALPGSESGIGGHVVVDAHLYGAIGGVLGATLTRIRVNREASI